jgi:hypothetical protein
MSKEHSDELVFYGVTGDLAFGEDSPGKCFAAACMCARGGRTGLNLLLGIGTSG